MKINQNHKYILRNKRRTHNYRTSTNVIKIIETPNIFIIIIKIIYIYITIIIRRNIIIH